ncbi:PEP/pyruvate-binding domain-containing protein [Streptomyces cavernae]|uniref:PEP/pyruvate-binding domain-containing protein n=1 Tax=Streptomyces cavernae TaxID=2259034 RepID=UPI001EE45F66|nr:PEP/pyruvate-binding domain-containing protein [Streptomyces cavernae]
MRLDDPRAVIPELTGSKAARLARAAAAGLPVLPGFVMAYASEELRHPDPEPTAPEPSGRYEVPGSAPPSPESSDPEPSDPEPCGAGSPDPEPPEPEPALRRAWNELSDGGTRPLAVRSSSPNEDTRESSQAGQFTSVLDVRNWTEFRGAVRAVLDSARGPDATTAPMAVLVQPMLAARAGGVLFGADPLAGRADRMLVSAVAGGPHTLVGGERSGTTYRLGRRGRVLHTEVPGSEVPGVPETDETGEIGESGVPRRGALHEGTGPADGTAHASVLTPGELRRLAQLARRARRVFGEAQDIEFGFDTDGRLWLFQCRPITAMAARPSRRARLLGPGPVMETLPDQLQPLEEDLWVVPMSRGLAAALDIAGSAPRRWLRRLPVVTSVDGRAAADLRLIGALPPRHRWLALLNPAPSGRRLAAAWRVGRLTSALPGLAVDLVADVDRRLTETPHPAGLPTPSLVSTLRWTRGVLVSLHAQEALAGALLPETGTKTAAGTALTTLARARALGMPDHRTVVAEPVVLALVPPNLRGGAGLPGTPRGRGPHTGAPELTAPVAALPTRETLRLRIRWVQELQVRLVGEAGRRLAARGALADTEHVGLLRWPELVAGLGGEGLPEGLGRRASHTASAPLPDVFRVTEDGVVVAQRPKGPDAGRGVSGGRAAGTVWDGNGPRPDDPVLVVRSLDPALAPLLPALTALVAQTGSPLSHLALLAREFGLPTVVGVTDAARRFPSGSLLTVDGTTGEVRPATDDLPPVTDDSHPAPGARAEAVP